MLANVTEIRTDSGDDNTEMTPPGNVSALIFPLNGSVSDLTGAQIAGLMDAAMVDLDTPVMLLIRHSTWEKSSNDLTSEHLQQLYNTTKSQ